MTPVHLRCCTLANPLGIHRREVELSWQFDAPSAGSSRQVAYRIAVASAPGLLSEPDMWASGVVESSRHTFIAYKGRPLESRMRCFWRVTVWDESGTAHTSAPAHWTMGLLNADDWKAAWIGLDYASRRDPRPAAPPAILGARWIWAADAAPGPLRLQTTFSLEAAEAARGAWIEVLAAASAEVSLNGKPVCRATHARANSASYAIPVPIWVQPGLLRAGENHLLVEASRRTGAASDPGEESPAIIAALRVEAANGPRFIATGSDWVCTNLDGGQLPTQDLGRWGARPWHGVSHTDYKRFPARYVRGEFRLPASPRSATLYFSGLGLSEAWINGQRVGDEVLSPPPTDYDRSAVYRTHDVTELLREGANAAGVLLGNGHLNPPRATLPLPTRAFGSPKLRWQLEVECADGSFHTVSSSPDWKITDAGPLGCNSEFDGEEFCDDPAFDGWNCPGFDDSSWYAAEMVPPPGGSLKAVALEPIRVLETLRPVSIRTTKYGTALYDFGRNLVGWCRVRAKGSPGTRLRLRHAETLATPDALSLDNLRTALCLDTVVLADRPLDWSPRFTYHGFRFVELRVECGILESLEVEACDTHNDVASIGEFHCSNEVLNKIVGAARWGILGNYRDFPTDCPQRDERMAWLGDRSRGCCGEMFLFGVAALYAKWIEDIVEAQLPSGGIPDVAPAFWSLYNHSVTWPSTIVFAPWFLYRQYGDDSTFRRHFPAIRKWLDFALSMCHNGFIERDTYGDWCVPPESPEIIWTLDPARKCHRAILASCYLHFSLRVGAEFARALGHAEDAERWTAAAALIAATMNERFYDPQRGYYDNGSQTASLLPLANGMVPPEHVPSVVNHLVTRITEDGDPKIGTGLVGTGWLLRTLVAHGHCDLAYALATRTAYPSWGYMVEHGATTIWELWNGDTARPDMNSGNHVMLLGDLIPFLFEDLAGIQPAEPGFSTMALRPNFPAGLDHVRAALHGPAGEISSVWRRAGEQVEWHVRVPANTAAVTFAPAGWEFVGHPGERPLAPGDHQFHLRRTASSPSPLAGC